VRRCRGRRAARPRGGVLHACRARVWSAVFGVVEGSTRVRGGRPRGAGSWRELTCGASARESAVRRAVAALVQLGVSTAPTIVSYDTNDLRHVG